MFRSDQVWILDEDPVRMRPRFEEQQHVRTEISESQPRCTCLTRTEQLAWAAQREILLGDAKAVGRRDHRGEAAAAVFADAFAGEEQAVRRALPASDAAAKLVELGEAEAV